MYAFKQRLAPKVVSLTLGPSIVTLVIMVINLLQLTFQDFGIPWIRKGECGKIPKHIRRSKAFSFIQETLQPRWATQFESIAR